MPGFKTGKAIGRVTELIRLHLETILQDATGIDTLEVSVGRPEPPEAGTTSSTDSNPPRLNIYLYEIQFDGHMKNVSLEDERQAPLWLVLKYLLTAYDTSLGTDSCEAHDYLGEAIKVLQDLNYWWPTSEFSALLDNPEPLKITFDEASADLISKIMQGTDDKYLFSAAFQVRPVMISSGEPPSYSLLVGVDYSQTMSELPGEEGVHIDVFTAVELFLTGILPARFEADERIAILGKNLDLSGLEVELNSVRLKVLSQKVNRLQCMIDDSIALANIISAGSHPLRVVQKLPENRRRSSNIMGVFLRPRVDNVEITLHSSGPNVVADIVIDGRLLGTENDDIIVTLYDGENVVKMFEFYESSGLTITGSFQEQLTLNIAESDKISRGEYYIIVRVNGQQAKNSPKVKLVQE
jgi:hypothetical protein